MEKLNSEKAENNLIGCELKLPCGAVLKNRIAKSAMSENMADRDHRSNKYFRNLYERWAKGGSGLLITGNIMIDRSALGEPNNIVFEKGIEDRELKNWALGGTQNHTHLWTQLNHPGKQSPKFLSKSPVAPSAIELKNPLNRVFNKPRALSEKEIEEIIERFAIAAQISKENGFTGVQIHGAHGYLVSQFLSPRHNQRTDKWGGSIENRMRFVNEVYLAIRKSVGKEFPVGIKLNSADFQKGGLTRDESILVAESLSSQGIDLLEISGGTYEAPVMTGKARKESSLQREAYFIDYCEDVRKKIRTPLMLTGGFRTLSGMTSALETGACDIIGLARSLAISPDFPNELLKGKDYKSQVKPLTTGFEILDKIVPLEITWYTEQLRRMGRGKNPIPDRSPLASAFSTLFELGFQGLKKVR